MTFDEHQLFTALDFAAKAHSGQVDKAGVSYIYHPIAVALHMNSETGKIAALLHDVIEDSG